MSINLNSPRPQINNLNSSNYNQHYLTGKDTKPSVLTSKMHVGILKIN